MFNLMSISTGYNLYIKRRKKFTCAVFSQKNKKIIIFTCSRTICAKKLQETCLTKKEFNIWTMKHEPRFVRILVNDDQFY